MGARRSVLLLRHAKAVKRTAWDGPDPLRALSAGGVGQAEALVRPLSRWKPGAILTAPALRCRQTVAPAAAALELAVEPRFELAEGAPTQKTLRHLLARDEETLLCCGHGAELRELAGALEESGLRVEWLELPAPPAEPGPDRRLAVLDLGSTSFHLLVADVTGAGHLLPVEREKIMLRLGSVIARDGRIPLEIERRVLEAADGLTRTARRAGASRVLAVATAALREAKNGPALAREIEEHVGAPVRVLAGEEEARLMFGAFARRILLPARPTLGLDLGGGSLELALSVPGALDLEVTLPLGAARLSSELAAHDPLRKREIRQVVDRVRAALEPVTEPIRTARPAVAVAAGGTARALGELAHGLAGLRPIATVNEMALSIDELRSLTEVLVRADHEERIALPGIRRRRADLLPVGALTLLTVAETLGLSGYTLCDWGLREGVLLEAAASS